MLEQDPAGSVRDRRAAGRSRQQGGATASTKTAVTGDDVTRLEGWIDPLESELPPLRRSSSPADRRAGASLHVARTVCRRAERDVVSSRHRARRARDPRVHEPPVRSAVRHGARREPPRRCARTRVVSHDRSDGSRLRALRTARARALRELSRWPRASCPAAMRPHIAAIYAFARTADDYADEPGIANQRAPAPARRLGPGSSPRRGQTVNSVHRRDSRIHGRAPRSTRVRGARADDSRVPPAGDALRGPAERVSAGCDDDALRHMGRACSTIAVAQPILSAASCCGLRGYDDSRLDAQSDAVCTALQLANFWQDLGATGPSAASTFRATIGSAGAREEDLTAGQDDAGVAQRDGRDGAAHARSSSPQAAASATASAAGSAGNCG